MNSKQAKRIRKEFKSKKKEYKTIETAKEYIAGYRPELDENKAPKKDDKGEFIYEEVKKKRTRIENENKETASYKEAKRFFDSLTHKEKGAITKERKANGGI